MRYDIAPDIARLIADSRVAVDVSRRHLAQIKRELRGTETTNDAMRREIAAWRRFVRK